MKISPLQVLRTPIKSSNTKSCSTKEMCLQEWDGKCVSFELSLRWKRHLGKDWRDLCQ